jgi:hypothetical protein
METAYRSKGSVVSEALRDHMPPAYAALLPTLFDRPAIVEPRATCDDCAMCDKSPPAPGSAAGEDVQAPERAFFHPALKCCTYHPTLPNYLVGAVLSDESPDLSVGKERVRAKIVGRIGVTPQWLAAPRKYLVLLNAARDSSFGRSEALLCPYYVKESGRCSVWRHRESVCSTFFCKHTAGATGDAFWTALRHYLFHIERTLARHAAASVAPELVEPDLPRNLLTKDDLEDKPPGDYARIWKSWAGREETYYVECHRCISALGRDEFSRLVDEGAGKELLSSVVTAYEALTSPKLAARLVRSKTMRAVPTAGGAFVTTYSRYDSLFLTQDLYDLLGQFTDEPLETVVARLSREHEVAIPRELLLELQLHGVLTPPPSRPLAEDAGGGV